MRMHMAKNIYSSSFHPRHGRKKLGCLHLGQGKSPDGGGHGVRPEAEVLLEVGPVGGGRDPEVAQHPPHLRLLVLPRLGQVGPPRRRVGGRRGRPVSAGFLLRLRLRRRRLGSSGLFVRPQPPEPRHDGRELGVDVGLGEGEAEVLQALDLLELQLRQAPPAAAPAPPPARPPRLRPPALRQRLRRRQAVLPGQDGLEPRAVAVGDLERLQLAVERGGLGLVAPRPAVPLQPRRGPLQLALALLRRRLLRLLPLRRRRRRQRRGRGVGAEHEAVEPAGVVERDGLLRRHG
uniref:Uncharacterized protein n=1 Tax=Triticum urartu TaxID=4572 RepID=A0A8R7V4W1_TRIUA